MIGLPSSVTMPEIARFQIEMHFLACAGIEMNALKSAKSDERRTLDRRELEIELNYLIAWRSCRYW